MRYLAAINPTLDEKRAALHLFLYLLPQRAGPPGRGTHAAASCLPLPGKRLRPLFGLSGRGSRRTGRRGRSSRATTRKTPHRLRACAPNESPFTMLRPCIPENASCASPCAAGGGEKRTCNPSPRAEPADKPSWNTPSGRTAPSTSSLPEVESHRPSKPASPTCCLSASAAKTSWDKPPRGFPPLFLQNYRPG